MRVRSGLHRLSIQEIAKAPSFTPVIGATTAGTKESDSSCGSRGLEGPCTGLKSPARSVSNWPGSPRHCFIEVISKFQVRQQGRAGPARVIFGYMPVLDGRVGLWCFKQAERAGRAGLCYFLPALRAGWAGPQFFL